MCHRYKFKLSVEAAIEKFGIDFVDFDLAGITKDFYPLSKVAVVRGSDKHERELVGLEWGMLPPWWKPSEKHKSRGAFQRQCYNARSETAHEKPSYRNAFKTQRCLLLATEFFEYGSFFHLNNFEPYAFAGLWESWHREEEHVESCTMLTSYFIIYILTWHAAGNVNNSQIPRDFTGNICIRTANYSV